MPYCIRCGAKIPEDEKARFCPNCGAPLPQKARQSMAEKRKKELTRVAPLERRLILASFMALLCIFATCLGTLAKIEDKEAQDIISDFNEIENILQKAGIQFIFGNNMMYCLVMFIPFVGPVGGFYVLYSTGRVLAALSQVQGYNPLFLFLMVMVCPHAWLEYISYSLAISESVWLSFFIIKYRYGGLRFEVANAVKYISLCAVLLLAGAIIEMAIITSASEIAPIKSLQFSVMPENLWVQSICQMKNQNLESSLFFWRLLQFQS